MTVKFKSYTYDKVKGDANYIAEVSAQLLFLKNLEDCSHLKPSSLRNNYEERQLKQIKNTLSNIYLMLELHTIEGIADHIYNSEFKPK